MKTWKLIFISACLVSVAAATQLSFNSGQMSPLMKYRVDMDTRSMAAEELTNILVRHKGMALKRPGTEFIDDVNDVNDTNIRLIPFEYAENDAYVLEFQHAEIGFFRTTE
jgi:hypothetical protein